MSKLQTVVCSLNTPNFHVAASTRLAIVSRHNGRADPVWGTEAQRDVVELFAKAEGSSLVQHFVEFETGKGANALDRRLTTTRAALSSRKTSGAKLGQSDEQRMRPGDTAKKLW